MLAWRVVPLAPGYETALLLCLEEFLQWLQNKNDVIQPCGYWENWCIWGHKLIGDWQKINNDNNNNNNNINIFIIIIIIILIFLLLLKQSCYFSTIIRLVLEILATLVKSSKFFKGLSFVQNINNNYEESTIILSVIRVPCNNLRLETVVLLWLDTCVHWTWLLFQ